MTNRADEKWQEILAGYNGNMFLNSAMGKSAFAAGAACVIGALLENFTKRELNKLRQEFTDFTAAYMEASELMRSDPRWKEIDEQLRARERNIRTWLDGE
jgi:hypothetical protein